MFVFKVLMDFIWLDIKNLILNGFYIISDFFYSIVLYVYDVKIILLLEIINLMFIKVKIEYLWR